jgi:hypothetical protein
MTVNRPDLRACSRGGAMKTDTTTKTKAPAEKKPRLATHGFNTDTPEGARAVRNLVARIYHHTER